MMFSTWPSWVSAAAMVSAARPRVVRWRSTLLNCLRVLSTGRTEAGSSEATASFLPEAPMLRSFSSCRLTSLRRVLSIR